MSTSIQQANLLLRMRLAKHCLACAGDKDESRPLENGSGNIFAALSGDRASRQPPTNLAALTATAQVLLCPHSLPSSFGCPSAYLRFVVTA